MFNTKFDVTEERTRDGLGRKSSDVVWCDTDVNKLSRNQLNRHQSSIMWFTGLSGSGKSTIANALEKRLHQLAIRTYILDGDNVRHGLNGDLGFSDDDRKENIRRIGEVSRLFIDAGVMVLSSFISPFNDDRNLVRQLVNKDEFVEIYIKCPLEVCESRDVKGLYSKARRGEIKHFTGIDSAYEEPVSPELTIDSSELSVDEAVTKIISYLACRSFIEIENKAVKYSLATA